MLAYHTIKNIKIAYRALNQDKSGDGILWCGGFKSDMLGTKAEFIAEHCEESALPFLRFDYSGHGESEGVFEERVFSNWLAEASAMYAHSKRCNIIIGSSMGGWIALKLASALAKQGTPAKALLLIAPAPDFTEKLMWNGFSDAIKRQITEQGFWHRPSPFDPIGYKITKALIEDGKNHQILDAPIRTNCPIHIIAGEKDEDVPLSHIEKVQNALAEEEVTVSIIKDGDHRLSTPQDLAFLKDVLLRLM